MKPVSYDFDAMRNVDIRTVELAELVNINDVNIRTDLPFPQKACDYIMQIKNPYCFRCGDVAVKVSYSSTNTTLSDCMGVYTRSIF